MQPRKLGFYSQESGNIVSSTVGKGPGEFATSILCGSPSKAKNSRKESQKNSRKEREFWRAFQIIQGKLHRILADVFFAVGCCLMFFLDQK
jgi:CO/xanthine dehydrogenase Mo-binding subunit